MRAGSQPAFRLFEAFFTTPFFLFMNVGFWCGYKPTLRDAVYTRSFRWFGTERRTYGWGRHAQLERELQHK